MSEGVAGIDQLIAALVAMATRSRRTTAPMREAGGLMVKSFQTNFEAEGRPRWRRLKQPNRSGKIMQGPKRRFYRSLRYTLHGPTLVEAGTPDVTYSIFHHTGTTKMVARRSIVLQPSDVPAIGNIFRRHVFGQS